MGNPETATVPESKPAELQNAQPAAFHFPPITDRTLVTVNPQTGDIWLGFNPARFSLRVVLAWAAFQIENTYQMLEDKIRQAQVTMDNSQKKKPKKSLRDILTLH